MVGRTIADWIARIIVGLFWVALGSLVGLIILALGYTIWFEIGGLGILSILGGFGAIVALIWAFERNHDRKYRERNRLPPFTVRPRQHAVYELDQKLDADEELL